MKQDSIATKHSVAKL